LKEALAARRESALLLVGRLALAHVDGGVDEDHVVLRSLDVGQSRLSGQPGQAAPLGLARVEAESVEREVAVVRRHDLLVARLLQLDRVDLVAQAHLDDELATARALDRSFAGVVLAAGDEVPVLVHRERDGRVDPGTVIAALVLGMRRAGEGEHGRHCGEHCDGAVAQHPNTPCWVVFSFKNVYVVFNELAPRKTIMITAQISS
jgi:hypothetical protein